MAREYIGPPVNVRLPDDLLAQLDELAELEGVPRVEVIRRILAKHAPARLRKARADAGA